MTALVASRTSRACASIVLAGGLLAGCGSTPSTPTRPTATVTALFAGTPGTSMKAGQTLQLAASATLSDGRRVNTGFEIRWASADDAIATVNTTGLVTARADGSTAITATSGTISASTTILVRTGGDSLKGFVTQTAPRLETPVIDAEVTVVDGVYRGIATHTDEFGRFGLWDVNGVVRIRVSAPYFEDAEVTADTATPVSVRLAPAAGMIIDATGGFGGAQQQLTFGRRSTGPAHLTVAAYMSDYSGVEAYCGELRDDENRVFWQARPKGYEVTATLTLTGGKNYTLKVYDCTPAPAPRYGLQRYRLKAEHM